jgi:EmrB/QacA subfamily drug resistance transporter
MILGLLGLAQLMVVLDATIVNIALPSAQTDLGFSDANRQWIVTAYALAFGSLLLIGGRLGDTFGRRRTFVVGLIGFAGASALGGIAGSFGVLVSARALQGIFGALLAPSALGLLTVTFTDPDERSKAFGIFGAVAGGGGAIGLLLGGVLTEYLSWRWCLYVNLVIAIPVAIGAFTLLDPARVANNPHIDVPGTVTASLGLFALVYGFSHAESNGWGDTLTLVALIASAVLLIVFVMIQRSVADPLLPLRIVLDRNRGGALLAMALTAIGMFAVFLFLTFYLQRNHGYSPIKTGLAFLPMMATVITSATIGGTKLLPRFGPRRLAPTGMVLAAIGLAYLAQLDADSDYLTGILPALILMGAGLGQVFAPSIQTATSGVQPRDAGVASATVNTMQQVGGAVGTALLSTIAASATSSYISGHASGAGNPAAAIVNAGQIHGYTTAFSVGAAIFAVGAIIVGSLMRSGVLAPQGAGEPVVAH